MLSNLFISTSVQTMTYQTFELGKVSCHRLNQKQRKRKISTIILKFRAIKNKKLYFCKHLPHQEKKKILFGNDQNIQ